MKEKSIIKVLIADDHNLFRAGIAKLLKENQRIRIIGEAENGEEMISKYFELLPDLVIVDIAMPGMTGLEAVAQIREKDQTIKALFLSMYEGDEYIYKVLKSGGSGLINKNILASELIIAVDQVFEGKNYFPGKMDETSLENLIVEFESSSNTWIHNQEENINYREEQILDLLKIGLSSQEMAERLGLSKKTIDFYRSGLMKKFNLKSASDLIIFSVKHNQPEKKI